MSRDYKNTATAANDSRGSPFWVGILIGLLFGLCIALFVALYINKGANPFFQKQKSAEKVAAKPPEPQKAADARGPGNDGHAKGGEQKTRFDFYKILPGTE
ncbi:MAG TPA: hypothetical protein VJ846_09080, partial [Sphingomicrobium sp.]|nr:hypothetical protein [Sphingomicrobium sp.]